MCIIAINSTSWPPGIELGAAMVTTFWLGPHHHAHPRVPLGDGLIDSMARMKRTSRLLLDAEDDPLQAPTLFHTAPAPVVHASVNHAPVVDAAPAAALAPAPAPAPVPPRGSMVYGADDISYLVDGCADRQPLSVRLTSALALVQKFSAVDGSSARHLVRASDGLAHTVLSMMHSDEEALEYLGMLVLHGLCQLPAPPPSVADVLLAALVRDRPPPDLAAATPGTSVDHDASSGLLSKRRRRQVRMCFDCSGWKACCFYAFRRSSQQ